VNNAVDLSIRQFCEAWRLMCRGYPGQHMAAGAGIEYIFSGLPIGFFNAAILTAQSISGEALRAYGHEARAWAGGKAVPWLFVITHEELEAGVDASSILDGCGLAPVMPLTGMFAQQVSAGTTTSPDSLQNPDNLQLPDDLQLTVPQDDAGCSAVLDVNSIAYAVDLSSAKPVIGTRAFWHDHVPVLGTVGGAPVSSATVLMVDGYRYVALVATDPAHQRRGYAEAAMRRALEVAATAHGAQPTVLHATEAGRPVYQRMGYTPISTHTLFMDKAFLGGH
jgi:GNAT superfamily N-acetyltransferase